MNFYPGDLARSDLVLSTFLFAIDHFSIQTLGLVKEGCVVLVLGHRPFGHDSSYVLVLVDNMVGYVHDGRIEKLFDARPSPETR